VAWSQAQDELFATVAATWTGREEAEAEIRASFERATRHGF